MQAVFELWCLLCNDSPMSEARLILEFPNEQLVMHRYRRAQPKNEFLFAVQPCARVPPGYTAVAVLFGEAVRPAHDLCISVQPPEGDAAGPREWVAAILDALAAKRLVNSEALQIWRRLAHGEE
ncbi:hypothetical protein CCM_08613 [Cordyceps militaris CM01]|uniref:Uncharacterized protein n=1 Tax=Cordyceps militaris (strain CM01) TaxID=983644 RepID=G3JRX5_CORMM|nr:uncharacterized protein CCM_08613 [Cordyceps militaris CM01]EGX88568.1 hypothetical protein CCM_08613 [Cordyceps militaris CM01]